MPRYRLLIEYDGAPFCGWQRQAEDATVQGAVEAAVERFSGEAARLTCAGRTDAGVHATGQVAHLDLAKAWRTDTVRDAINAHLRPLPVAVIAADLVGPEFDARHSAIRRHYRYRILNRRSPAALVRPYVWHVPWALDAEAMHAAAQRLLGRHDFSAFRAAECQAASPVRTLERLDVAREAAGPLEEIVVTTHARSFLHHQVRSMVGTLMLAGSHRLTPDDVAAILAARDRSRCGPMAPACGLTLTGVDYADAGK
ncbi:MULTISPECIES: tRNA pseudouridine(38-40) synthase TruA [Methylobacterium]|uniref:tRNA pseudouridine synthase A n=1 Tax=Methylobacterium jeotgali TaxID=381630 RepID=A0ABQ4SS03_9HYPH|nr:MULTISPECIES: tRNA pseudouridine(38-40) synthase TruA [Methylobacterium]PIU04964.1 MAG: tRNA pseudouridine(38-40) synthase TruA [Methylobacterium sp. CG09_land_8_20_14_0_10_71_15]PIU11465.1 MAG: tRNA pseudouridine(38-40) synthase TruA [Methylobacterium sp. CG08_land_8_20_14_0_20_71_15]GBU18323.1 tRNA pseudouridine(38-40) synthase [Methylobacterium sp.]GJE05966.1 tRNA pseudouridine synthase A [Methylobacterium jeotgali]